MALSPEEVKKIAFLARLSIQEENIEQYSDDLSGILDLVEQMNAANVDDIEPMALKCLIILSPHTMLQWLKN